MPGPDALLLIQRAVRPGDPWSGQIGLPGGRRESADPDLQATARREAYEEVGLALAPGDLLGILDDLAPTSVHLPRLLVRPYVFLLPGRPVLRLNPEVAAAPWVLLDSFCEPGVYGACRVWAGDRELTRPGYRLSHGIVWGMTERILTPLLHSLQRGES